MKGEGMDKVREALPELPASQAFSLTRSIYTADDMHAYARAALASQAEKHAAELAKLRQWRDVADDMLTVLHEVASDDPRESIDRLINWHVQVALDPAVSSDAAALVEVGRQQGAKLRQGEARAVRYAALSGPAPSVPAVPIPLNIIRKWPEGFQDRLQHVWLDVVSFIPDVKLYDLQLVLAEFGFRMEVYEVAPLQAAKGGAE